MPRPKPKTGSPKWKATPYVLSKDAREELISSLHLDIDPSDEKAAQKAEEAIGKVQHWLGAYPGEAIIRRNIPKSSDYRKVLPQIGKDANKLKVKLINLHEWIQNDLIKLGANLPVTVKGLKMLADATVDILEIHKDRECRGPDKDLAVRKLLLELREIFARFYNGPESGRQRMGAIHPLSEKEEYEREFIEIACRDAGILLPITLPTFLTETDTTIASERRDNIYNKFDKIHDRRPCSWLDFKIDFPTFATDLNFSRIESTITVIDSLYSVTDFPHPEEN